MWAFLPGGLLMPAALPTLERDKVEVDPKWTDNGRFDLQVRGRVQSHLQNFIRDYMDPLGLDHSAMQLTPKMDYDCRFYCTKEDFAKAMAQACLDIDYQKFKPTAERRTPDGKYLMYEDGKEYHGRLNSIWSVLASLGNPYGGRSTWWGGGNARKSGAWSSGVSRFTSEDSALLDEPTGAFERFPAVPEEDMPDFIPNEDVLAEELWAQMQDLPEDQWEEYATEDEIKNMRRWRDEMVDAEAEVARAIEREPRD